MKNYSTLIFDAFDTVVHIDLSKLPTYRVDGQMKPTTAPAVHAVYEDSFGKVDFDIFYRAFSQSYKHASEIRRSEHREITSQHRFRTLLAGLGQNPDEIEPSVLNSLTQAHMTELQRTFHVREETLQFLEWAASRFRRAMISNFDYAPALYEALDRFGIRSAFEVVTVSDEVGWRKPHPIIFQRTFEEMRVDAVEALFIGDQLYVDVYGALNAGMDVVWLETENQDWVPDVPPQPTFTVRSIDEIIPLLENTPS